MPVGNVELPNIIYPINGVRIGVTSANIRYQSRDDLVVFELAEGTNTAVVTTQNAFCASPVKLVRQHIKQATPQYLLVNTGNANAGTGVDGDRRALATCQALAEKTNVNVKQILPYSTGVIGETLNSEAMIAGLDNALENLSMDNWQRGANGILTTDTVAKLASEQVEIADSDIVYHVTGMAKGAGMIRPNMATMLGFVATDANISTDLLQTILHDLVEKSFNRITIDGDTSTNDCCTLVATAKVGELIDSKEHPYYLPLLMALEEVFIRLATLVVRDGEGVTKFITVKVTGGKDNKECCDVAYAVAHSPLVKTAFFASDPNWGRILASVGYAGLADLDTTKISIHLDDVLICQRGQRSECYQEHAGQGAMNRPEICIHIELGRGQASDTVYTCDLSYEYVKINADYRS